MVERPSGLKALLIELRRRRVIRAALIYGIVLWVVIQIAETVFPVLLLPEWSVRLVVALALLGFPVTVVLAWIFDVGPGGVQRTDAAGGAAGLAPGARSALLVFAIATAVVILIGVWQWAPLGSSARQDVADRSIAVFPFLDLSEAGDQEYFSDGITEEILNALAQVEGLQVAARTSSFRFKGPAVDIPAAAQQLNVAHVLEGSVRKSGSRLRITAQLIDARSGFHLWSQNFDREDADIFAIQDEIARAFVAALRVTLMDGEAPVLRQATASLRAHELYLLGRFHWHKRTDSALHAAERYFRQAIDEDPGYALAWAGLAETWAVLPSYSDVAPATTIREGVAAAERAIALDSTLADPHAALGIIKTMYEWDWAGADRAFRAALERNPQSVTAHQWRRLYLLAMGDVDAAWQSARRARDLDPLSLITNLAVGTPLYYARRYEEAAQQFQRTLALDSSFVRAYSELGDTYVQMGRFEEAIAAHRRAVELSGATRRYVSRLGYALARAGREAEARRILDDLRVRSRPDRTYAFDVAVVYVGLDERGEAFDWLDRAIEERDNWMAFLNIDPVFDPLREDPRFAALVQRVGLPQ